MLTKINSVANVGLETVPVDVEVDVASQGFPGFTIVGLASKAVEEARERVKTAIVNSGFDFPPKKITVNLAPADLPKDGAAYDLPIAVGVLIASGQLVPPTDSRGKMFFYGELSSTGRCGRRAAFYFLRFLQNANPVQRFLSRLRRLLKQAWYPI